MASHFLPSAITVNTTVMVIACVGYQCLSTCVFPLLVTKVWQSVRNQVRCSHTPRHMRHQTCTCMSTDFHRVKTLMIFTRNSWHDSFPLTFIRNGTSTMKLKWFGMLSLGRYPLFGMPVGMARGEWGQLCFAIPIAGSGFDSRQNDSDMVDFHFLSFQPRNKGSVKSTPIQDCTTPEE